MQKVVAIFLKAWTPNCEHLQTEELLSKDLQDGWRVAQVTAAGGASEMNGVGAWAIFTLEK